MKIPQEVGDYEEIIVFGLRRRQVIYALLTIFALALIYLELEFLGLEFLGAIRYILMVLIAFAGASLTFLNVERWASRKVSYLRSPKRIGFLDEKALEFIDVANIRDGVAYMKNGDLKAIIQVQPMNFSVLDERQQNAVFESYKNFLDSLSGSSSADAIPLQVAVKTHQLNLDEFFDSIRKRAEAATAVSSSLRRFVKGSYSFINRQTNIKKLEGRFITFKIGSLPREVRRILMFIILEFIYNRMKNDLRKKMLVVDEAWKLLQTESEEGYILNIVKTCRHHNMGLVLVTQDVYDLLTSKAGKAVMANSSWQLLLRMKPSIIDDVASTFKLNETTKNYLLTAEPGSGLLFVSNTFIPLKNVVGSEEYRLFTTHPEDRRAEHAAKD